MESDEEFGILYDFVEEEEDITEEVVVNKEEEEERDNCLHRECSGLTMCFFKLSLLEEEGKQLISSSFSLELVDRSNLKYDLIPTIGISLAILISSNSPFVHLNTTVFFRLFTTFSKS